jgi:TAG lipase/lysophosphatidylethanolamine acyltransferase
VAIEDYIDQVISVLDYVAKTSFEGVSIREKFDLLNDSRQSFGRTALLFQGGSTFGLVHLGVAKCLYEQNMLPKIICGNSVGALIAAMVCTKTEDELPVYLFP